MTSPHLSAVADPSTAQRGTCQIQPLAMALPRKWALFEKITKTFLNNHPFYWCSIIFCLLHACWSWPVRVVSTCVWNGSLSEKKKRTRDPIYRTGHMDWLLLWVRFPKQRSSLHWTGGGRSLRVHRWGLHSLKKDDQERLFLPSYTGFAHVPIRGLASSSPTTFLSFFNRVIHATRFQPPKRFDLCHKQIGNC